MAKEFHRLTDASSGVSQGAGISLLLFITYMNALRTGITLETQTARRRLRITVNNKSTGRHEIARVLK